MSNAECEIVQVKRERKSDEVFYTNRVKYEPCEIVMISKIEKHYGSRHEKDLTDHSNASLKCEEQKRYVAVEPNTQDVNITDFSTIECKTEEIKREEDICIHCEDVISEDVRPSLACHKTEVQEEPIFRNGGECDQETFFAHQRDSVLLMMNNRDTPIQYKNCSVSFTDLNALKSHDKFHTGGRLFKCKFCFKAFTHSSNTKVHERIHTGDRPFHCKICSKAFANSNHLKRHERLHTGERPFHCKVCSKAFSDSSNRKIHERIHTGDRPFKCTICSKAFVYSSGLKRHEKIHNREVLESSLGQD